MSDVKYSSLCAIAIVVLTLLVFAMNYNGYPGAFSVYRILAWPGIAALRLFSEELVFLPKFIILLSAQFLAYFFVVFAFKKIVRRLR
jgi:hypothetical protein